MLSSSYLFKITVYQILVELCPYENSVNFSFLANSSNSLYPIKLKIDLLLDHGVEECIFFHGYSTPNINGVMPLWKFLLTFCFRLTAPIVIQSSCK